MHNKYFLGVLFLTLILASCSRPIAQFSYNGKTEAPANINFKNECENAEMYEWDFGDGKTSQSKSPTHKYDEPGNYTIILKAKKGKKETMTEKEINIAKPKITYVMVETSMGNMKIKLYNSTPKHRDNFLKLAKEGFYDDLLFHRVINQFMVQGGDPNSRGASAADRLGSGGPGYQVDAELGEMHYKGTLAAARTNNPQKRSSGSQFYIVHGKAVDDAMLDQLEKRSGKTYTAEQRTKYKELGGVPFLDHEYTVYGEVVEGMDVIDKIAATKTAPGDRPVEDVKMKIRVVE